MENLDLKFNIQEIKIIQEKKMSIGALIANRLNFQNLDLIGKVFSKLIGKNFFSELREFSTIEETKRFDLREPFNNDYYEILRQMIELRHIHIHNFHDYEKISDKDINKFSNSVYNFCLYLII